MLKIPFYNPIVSDWNPEAIEEENEQKRISKYHLYTITPLMTGCYSIAELMHSAHTHSGSVIFCPLRYGDGKLFNEGQWKSIVAVGNLIDSKIRQFGELHHVADFLNSEPQ